jgi:hypothetical protein
VTRPSSFRDSPDARINHSGAVGTPMVTASTALPCSARSRSWALAAFQRSGRGRDCVSHREYLIWLDLATAWDYPPDAAYIEQIRLCAAELKP